MTPSVDGLQILLQLWKAWISQAPQHRHSKHPQALAWTLMRCMQPQQLLRSSSRAAFWGAWTLFLPQLPPSPIPWATLLQGQCRALVSQVCQWAGGYCPSSMAMLPVSTCM